MSVVTMMNQAVTLRKLSGFSRDNVGGAEPTYDELDILAYLEPQPPIGLEGEDVQNGNTEMGRWLGSLPADTDMTGWDQLVYGELVLEFTGPPRPMWNPRTHTVSHIEVSLRAVQHATP